MLRVVTGRSLQQHQLGEGCTGLAELACRLSRFHLRHQRAGIGSAFLHGGLFTVVVSALQLGMQGLVFGLLPVFHPRFERGAGLFMVVVCWRGRGG